MDFDRQAERFDDRAGLPATACEAIVAKVLTLTAPNPADLCLEIGAGTGQLGRRFAERLDYIGIDASGAMLEEFRKRTGPRTALVQADAARRWPLADRAARIVFGSRVLHLLDPEHVAAEAARVIAADGGWLLIGQVRRGPDGVRARLRALLHELLAEHGHQPRAKGRTHDAILAASEALGARPLSGLTPSRWRVAAAPAASIAAWRSKPGLAGIELPAAVQRELLDELEARARRVFPRLDRPVASVESYRLEGCRFGDPRPGV